MKNKDRLFREITSLCEGAIPLYKGDYIGVLVENDYCEIVFFNLIYKSRCLFAVVDLNDIDKCSVTIKNITKRKAVRLLKHYGFKVDWDGYNEQIYGEQK